MSHSVNWVPLRLNWLKIKHESLTVETNGRSIVKVTARVSMICQLNQINRLCKEAVPSVSVRANECQLKPTWMQISPSPLEKLVKMTSPEFKLLNRHKSSSYSLGRLQVLFNSLHQQQWFRRSKVTGIRRLSYRTNPLMKIITWSRSRRSAAISNS